ELVQESLQRSDLVAVATYSTTGGPRLVVGFTPDHRQVEYAIDTLGLPKLGERHPDPLGMIVAPESEAGGLKQSMAGKSDMERAFIDNLKEMAQSEARADRRVQANQVTAMTRSL